MVEIEIGEITGVREFEDHFDVTKDNGWSLFIDKKYKVVPRVGDSIIIKLTNKLGQIMGIQINDKELFSKTEEQFQSEHQEWVEKTKKRHQEEYLKLMESIKKEEPFETVNISGMGSGYERACQLALRSGIKWLEEHPDFKFRVKSYTNIYGVATIEVYGVKEYESLVGELEKVMLEAVNNDMTGAMHQAVIGHLRFINDNSYDEWLTKLSDRKYLYPTELPPPAF